MSFSKFVFTNIVYSSVSIPFKPQNQPHLSHLISATCTSLISDTSHSLISATGTSLISDTSHSLISATGTSLISATMPGPRGRSRISEKGGGGGVVHFGPIQPVCVCVCVCGGGGAVCFRPIQPLGGGGRGCCPL